MGLLRLFCLLPYPILMVLGKGLGYAYYSLAKSRRKVVEVNLDICLPELGASEKQQLCKDTMLNAGIGMIEGFYAMWASDKALVKRSTFSGKALLEQAKADGQGVILLGAHFSPIEIIGHCTGLNIPLDITYRPQDNPVVEHLMIKARSKHYGQLITKSEMRQMVRNLKKGHTVWYTCDQDFGRKYSTFAPFFGTQAATIATLGRMIKMTKPKVLFLDYRRDSSQGLSKSHYYIDIIDPFDNQLGDDDEANAPIINQVLEARIRENLDQYFWMHKRFKRRPNKDDKKFY